MAAEGGLTDVMYVARLTPSLWIHYQLYFNLLPFSILKLCFEQIWDLGGLDLPDFVATLPL